tara:strand:+ start:1047 stop:1973 length:927 start_codon:yes stop_codon:yes gene_type:complete
MYLQETKEKLVILLYHGVSEYENRGICNLQGKHISYELFSSQMKFIKKNCNPVSINDWIEIKNDHSSIPPNPVIISFDDGFENNYTTACPILDKFNIPAVFYISSGMIGTNKMFWVDVLENLIEECKKPSIVVKLDKPKKFYLNNNLLKFQALKEIKSWCKLAKNDEKERLINELRSVTNVNPNQDSNPNYSLLNWKQVSAINDNSLFTIGGHSLNHNILSSLDEEDMKFEIEESLRLIYKNLGKKTIHYSYPEGQQAHFNNEVISLLKENGIVCCPTAIEGYNTYDEDLFNLRRVMVGFEKISFPYL